LGLKEWLIPQDKAFFDILERESRNVVSGAHELEDALTTFDAMDERRKRMKDIEHEGDEIVHEIYFKVNKTFITPIDQEDITKLASLYDDVLDYIYAVINRVVLYEIKEPTEAMKKFAEIVRQSVDEIHAAFLSMRRLDEKEIDKRIIEIDRLENEADTLLNDSVAELFKSADVIRILRLKEIYENLEIVTDKCEDVGLELRDILLKQT
jgi:predicted phosphate transport protein (TIGR00153 family)